MYFSSGLLWQYLRSASTTHCSLLRTAAVLHLLQQSLHLCVFQNVTDQIVESLPSSHELLHHNHEVKTKIQVFHRRSRMAVIIRP